MKCQMIKKCITLLGIGFIWCSIASVSAVTYAPDGTVYTDNEEGTNSSQNAATVVPVTAANNLSGNSVSQTQSGSYVIADSNTRVLSVSDLQGLSSKQLTIARNEIYARHGRKFVLTPLQNYFNSCSWYQGTIEATAFDANENYYLNSTERANVELIYSFQGYPDLSTLPGFEEYVGVTGTNQDANTDVWITNTGKSYHSKPDCGNSQSSRQVTLQYALGKGYTRCTNC